MDEHSSKAEFEDLYHSVESHLGGFVMNAVRSRDHRDEIVQEVATVLWAKFNEYDRARPFIAWAIGMARLQIMKHREKMGKRSRHEILSDGLLHTIESEYIETYKEEDPRLQRMRDCLKHMKTNSKQLFTLYYGKSMKLQDIASELGKSLSAIKVALLRGRHQLKACIEKGHA